MYVGARVMASACGCISIAADFRRFIRCQMSWGCCYHSGGFLAVLWRSPKIDEKNISFPLADVNNHPLVTVQLFQVEGFFFAEHDDIILDLI